MNGICESTHGFGDAGSFSLLALRSWTIANALMTDLRAAVEPRPRRITEPPLAVSA
jgi:L-ornithine N5-oxygenase